jgi:AcrR family transcriptional regulator
VAASALAAGRREELRDAMLEWVLEHGVGALSLRPLAQDLRISTYALVYWFGSKQGVVSAVLERSQERQRAMVINWAEEFGEIAPGAIFRQYWAWSRSPEGIPYVRLFVEMCGLAQRSPALRRYVDGAIEPWRELFYSLLGHAGVPAEQAAERTTILCASIAGLQVDLSLSGAADRIDAAAELLAQQLDALGSLPLNAPVPEPFTRLAPGVAP